ncbi:hypothetical protein [Clostridium sp. 1001271B_151109_B4]|uniref:hypothetical protein n=1 Tax=Clostridium sp. 1001271B_151109_B4 TaxID=2787148 RepID=UPI0018A985D4|nr:hypothetical protein [Clostridium sp. 1001271B_151109_B4]
MFISIPKEFFVPVVFSDSFILNKETNHLEFDTNLYRESTGKTKSESISKTLENSKSANEKQDILQVEMSNVKCGKSEEEAKTAEKKDNTIYMSLKKDEDEYKKCEEIEQIFTEIDEEFIGNIVIKGCEDK